MPVSEFVLEKTLLSPTSLLRLLRNVQQQVLTCIELRLIGLACVKKFTLCTLLVWEITDIPPVYLLHA